MVEVSDGGEEVLWILLEGLRELCGVDVYLVDSCMLL